MALDPFVLEEVLNVFCGDLIGSGISRKVFALPHMPDYVAKIEEGPHQFQNVMEWWMWYHVAETEHAKWFAPCKAISPNGRVLIMRKTEIRPHDTYPQKVPMYLTDTKFSNYGTFDGRLVCHDYGTCLMPTYGLTKRMKRADWWE